MRFASVRGGYFVELIDKFIEFEYKNGLFAEETLGVNFWPYIRKNIYGEIRSSQSDRGQAHTNIFDLSFKERWKNLFKLIPNMIFKNPVFNLDSKDLLILNHQRKMKDDGEYKCIYSEPFLNNIDDISYYVMEKMYVGQHYPPSQTVADDIRFFDYIFAARNVKRRAYDVAGRLQLAEDDKNRLRNLFRKIENEFSVELEIESKIDRIQKMIRNYKIRDEYLRKILNRVEPESIVEVVYYGGTKMHFNELAEKLGVKTIELQHGIMGDGHISYNFYDSDIKKDFFPDYVLTFGDYWKDSTRFPIDSDNIISVGFPYLNLKYKELEKNNKSSNTVLFISQGTIGKKLSKLACQLEKRIERENINYDIIYKLHPGEYDRWEEEYPWLKDSEIEVIDSNEYSIYHYMINARIQIGVSSTAVFEGLKFGLETYIFNVGGSERMKDLIENGNAKLIDDANEIDLEDGVSDFNGQDLEYYWKDNALENMKSAVKEIIGK